MTPSQLIAYYVSLLIMQYFGLPKATGMIASFVNPAVADMIIMQVRAGFTLATSTGKQLDCLAELVGLHRQIAGFDPSTPEFSMPRYADPDAGTFIGFARYVGLDPNGHWARYADQVPAYVMTDGQLSQLIQYVVAVRASNYSIKELDDIFFQFFGTLVTITDNGNMSMTYSHSSTDPGTLFSIIDYLRLLPHPAGVSYSVVTV